MSQLDLSFTWSGLTLSGTLHLPASDGRHPVVLMMQGSGSSDRDSYGYFPPIRETFLSRGIATYSFDKPGCGVSTGDWRDYALEDRADQATAALDALAEHPRVDSGRMGVWGHSQGGWLAQILAGSVPSLGFAVASSGPSIGVAEQDLYGCEHTMRAQGRSEEEIAEALSFVSDVHQAALAGSDYAGVDAALLRSARSRSWYGYLTIDEPEDWRLVTRFLRERYDPVPMLRKARCAFLAVYGGRDLLVPAWRSAEETGVALEKSDTSDATIVVFPEGDHRLLLPDTDEFVPGYLDLLGDWAKRQTSLL